MTIQPSSPQMMIVLQALADAAAYRRALVAAWCERCETTPDGSCPEHLADLAAAETYDALARELTAAPAELMTRLEVAYLLETTTAVVARWARSGKLTEIHGEDGRARYRRSEAEALHRGLFPEGTAVSGQHGDEDVSARTVADVLRAAADALTVDLAVWAARDPAAPSPEVRRALRSAGATADAVVITLSALRASLEAAGRELPGDAR